MSQVTRTANHCDALLKDGTPCNHEWLPTPGVVYTHCTSGKCRSRRWNLDALPPRTDKPIQFYRMELPTGAVAQPDRALAKEPEVVGSIPTVPIKPDIQALWDICAGNIPTDPSINLHSSTGGTMYSKSYVEHEGAAEIPICGKTWWEDGEQYECLMDKGHKALKCGQRGMVRNITA